MSRVLAVLSSNPTGPGVRHRWHAYALALARAGVALEVVPWPKDRGGRAAALARLAAADGAVIASRLLRLLDLRRVRRVARRLALDFDDALPFRDSRRGARPSLTRRLRFRRTVRLADRVFAGNDYLAGLAAAEGVRALVLPTTVTIPPGEPTPEPPEGPWVLGWIGSRVTVPYLEALGPVLARVAARVGPLRLRVVADAFPPAPEGVEVEAVPWSEARALADLARIHIGVAPLPDDPWTRGKCGLKVLQMLSVARPVVAHSVGVQTEQVRDGETGFLVRDGDGAEAAILRLVGDRALRRRLGEAGREDVRRRWSVEAWAPAVVRAVEGLLA